MNPKRFKNVVEHAGSGMKIPEMLARQIDGLSKGLPKDFNYRRIAKITSDFSLQPGERTDISTITTNDIDRDGECVFPAGGDWKRYNRVVTFAHKYDQLPVGANWWIRPNEIGNGLIAKTQYPPVPPDWNNGSPWLPSAILHLMQQPVPTCTGKSIGFLPLNIRQPTGDEIAKRPELKGIRIIDKWQGLEYAVAPIPCLPEAEMIAVSKGIASGALDVKFAEMIRQGWKDYQQKTKTIVAVNGLKPSTKRQAMSDPNMPDAPADPNAPAAMGDYAHLDFKPPMPVQEAHKDGLSRHKEGETEGQMVPPETIAMARHMAAGGAASPASLKAMDAFHNMNPAHAGAKPGTPAFAMSQLHGGAAGKAWSGGMCKAMDDADGDNDASAALPPANPMVKVDDPAGKAAGENVNGAGGDIVPPDMPICPKCKSVDNVEPLPNRGISPTFKCTKCMTKMDAEGKDMEDGDDGEEEEAMKVAASAETKAAPLATSSDTVPDGTGDPACPSCGQKAAKGPVVPVPGVGDADSYACTKCDYKFLVPQVAPRAPMGGGSQTGAPGSTAKVIKPFVKPETVTKALAQAKADRTALVLQELAPALMESLDRRLGRV